MRAPMASMAASAFSDRHQERAAELRADDAVFEALDGDAPAFVGFRISRGDARADGVHGGLRFFERDAGLEAGEGEHPVIVAGHVARLRNPPKPELALE